MTYSERAPSSEWVPVQQLGEVIAEAWFKPAGEPLAVAFRVSASRLHDSDWSQALTVEDLLRAVAIPIREVESWQFSNESHLGLDGTNPELNRLLPPPPPSEAHLAVHVRLRPVAHAESGTTEVPAEKWQALDAIWKSILGLEVSIDTLRLNMDGLRNELENAFKHSLAVEEKVHALQADVVQWTKAKSRVHYVLPKLREFVHRATWAVAVPERKRVEELVTNHIEPQIPHPRMDEFDDQLGHLQKDRQVLYAQGNSANQEGRGVLAEIQRSLSALQRNAVERSRQKRSSGRDKGKHL